MLLLEQVFEVLNNSGLDYCVQNKYEMMPEEIPSDIDIMYDCADDKRLDEIVAQTAIAAGLIVTQKVVHDYYQYTYVLSYKVPKEEFRLQLDFSKALSLHEYKNVMTAQEMLRTKRKYKCFYVPDYSVELVYLIMRRTIKKDMDNEHLKLVCELLKKDYEGCVKALKENFGSEIKGIVLDIAEKKDLDIFYSKHEVLSKKVMEISRKKTSFGFKAAEAKFNITEILPQRIFKPVGISVAFIAPDGAGKSTLIDGISKTCAGSFYGVKKYYFRPRLLKNAGSYKVINAHGEDASNPDPHGVKPDGRIKSLVRFAFYMVDFIVGYNVKIRKDLIKKKLVIFDRYYYDYYADMLRYRYSLSSSFAERMSFMIPKPDMIFVLKGKAEVFRARKAELTIDEINSQLKAFEKLGKFRQTVFIDADVSAEEVRDDVTALIIKKKAKDTLRVLKIDKDTKQRLDDIIEK